MIQYSPLLSAPLMAALQSRERYVSAALKALFPDGSFRWTTWTFPKGPDLCVLRKTDEHDRCVVWFSESEIKRKFTEARIMSLIRAQSRTTPGHEEPTPSCE